MELVRKPAGRVILGGLLILAGAGAGALAVSPSASAATSVTLYVAPGATGTACTASDPSDACGSISTAVNVATGGSYNGDDVTIMVAAGTYGAPGSGDQSTVDPSSLNSLTIEGAGPSTTIVDGGGPPTDKNDDQTPVFNIQGSGTVSIDGLTITDGSSIDGGGVLAVGETDVAPYELSLTLTDDTLSNDTAYGYQTEPIGGYGGAIWASGVALVLSDDTLSNDFTSGPFAGLGGAVFAAESSTILSNDTLNDDSAYFGGGLYLNNSSTATLSNDTLTGDSATQGGAIYAYQATATLDDDTLSDDTDSTGGGGVYAASTDVTIGNSILQSAPCFNEYGSATITDGGYNVESDDTCGFGPTSIVNSSTIGLQSLAANGSSGPETMAIGPISAAFEEVPPSACTVTTDERGYPRPGVPGENCDAGSYELYQPTQGPPTSDSVADGTAYANQLTLLNPSAAAGPVNWTTTTSSPDLSVSSSGAVTAPASDPPATYTVSGTMADAAGDTGKWSFSLTVAPPSCSKITITTTSLPEGTLGQPYSFALSACGGNVPYTWNKYGPKGMGRLPVGVGLSRSGVISGTPKRAGTYTIVAKCLDSSHSHKTQATKALTLTINP